MQSLTMLKQKGKTRAKSTKDKGRNSVIQTISGPSPNAGGTLVRKAGEGLYMKLIQHQKSIATQLKFITSALQDFGSDQYRSRHKKTDLVAVVTTLLRQLDSAVSTTHQCLTKDLLDKDPNVKPDLDHFERQMYAEVAALVKWIDFDSKGAEQDISLEREKITEMIKKFEVSLAEIVRLVYDTQLQPNGTVHQRRSSFDSTSPGSIRKSQSIDGPGTPGEELVKGHPAVEQLRQNTRKTSWAPISSPGAAAFRAKSNTLMPVYSPRDSGMSEGSSGGASDEELRRRSGSSDHYLSGGQSPEHSAYSRESVSPDWDSHRVRGGTTPSNYDTVSHSHSHPSPSSSYVSTVSSLVADSSLPPLPGETFETPPPLPGRGESDDHRHSYHRKGSATLPRMSDSIHINGRMSPEAIMSRGSGGNFTDGGGGSEEAPPPLPIKKKKKQQHHQHLANGGGAVHQVKLANAEAPPPIPIKTRRSTTSQHFQSGSPITTPTHNLATPQHPVFSPGTPEYSMGGVSVTDGSVLPHSISGECPPVPLRIDSIAFVKNVMNQEAPPPKPPRSDRPNSAEMNPSQLSITRGMEALKTIRKYNEDIRKAKNSGPGAVPPVPLKKKTVKIYQTLLDTGYTYDETQFMERMYIPDMEAPPPIPPKKRRRRKPAARDVPSSTPSPSSSVHGDRAGEKDHRGSSASTGDDLAADDLEEGGDIEVNYLEVEESSPYLKFNKEEDGGYTLKGGPVDALISYAASSGKSVKHFSEAFLLTYYTFITPSELISKLIYRLNYFYGLCTSHSVTSSTSHATTPNGSHAATPFGSHAATVWQATTSLLVRALTSLKQPLSKEAQISLIGVVHQMITDGNLKFAQLLRDALVVKLNQLMSDASSDIFLGHAFQSKGLKKIAIFDFTPEHLARQMTILDNEIFQKLDVSEMLYWAKEQNEEKCPMLTKFTLHFNNVSQWTKVMLLKRGVDMKYRVRLINCFIAIMKSLLETFNNFSSYLAILSAIESSPISRLDWPDRVVKGLEEPRQLIDNRGSFKNLREAFAHAKPPCIPYIGMYLQDLTFIEMQRSKLQEDHSSINFTKLWNQFKSVDHIRLAQTKQYTYPPDPEIMSFFGNFEVTETDEELWKISTEIKPSQRSQRT